MARTETARPGKGRAAREPRRYDRVKRRFSSQRRPKELVRDLLRAHSGE